MKRICMAALLALALALTGGAAAQESQYADGIYRGFYYDGGIEQIAIQFELQDGVFQSVVYRGVKYKDGDYMSDDASDAQKAALRQYRELAAYLVGKGVDAIDDLYAPYGIVEDIDAVTTATMQSSKLISALWDGLNRRPFKLLSTRQAARGRRLRRRGVPRLLHGGRRGGSGGGVHAGKQRLYRRALPCAELSTAWTISAPTPRRTQGGWPDSSRRCLRIFRDSPWTPSTTSTSPATSRRTSTASAAPPCARPR